MSVNLNHFHEEPLTAGGAPLPNEDIDLDFNIINHDSSLPITYKMEFRLLIPVLLDDQPDPHPDDPRLVLRVAENTDYTLIEMIVQHHVSMILQEQCQVFATTHLGTSYPPIEALDIDPQWIVATQNDSELESVDSDDPLAKLYTWVGVKVESSKWNMSCGDHSDQINEVMQVLCKNLRMRLPYETTLFLEVGEEAGEP
ncbi:hypothetical protein F5B19DRAFT_480135 [Rostrohypoxylon terebratum]|nr:hypothetical protein F5B19DRAFT_480135 [Rostrohypoxylon terebratum]